MRKKYIMAPGPTPIPAEVLAEASMMIPHHRTPQFQAIFKAAHEGLQMIFRTKQPVMTFASVGTGVMESAVANLTSPGEKVLVAAAGHFGNRWKDICAVYGVSSEHYEAEWGKAVDPEEVRKRLKANPEIKLVYTTLNETSTGVVNDIEALTKVAHEAGALIVVDAISGLGAMPCETDAWGIDLVLSGSQKGFMIPPGLGFVCAGPKAVEKSKMAKNPRYYFSYEKAIKKLVEEKMPDTPFTPAISLIIQLKKALELMKEEGMENVWKRHAGLAKATRAGVEALGLQIFAPTAPSNALTAVVSPEGIDSGLINKTFRDTYGISIAGGQAKVKGKIFRLGHLGYVDGSDVILGVGILEMVLHKVGKKVPLGAGVKAAEEILLAENL
ncbi:MAG TPA: alanine--glyoxylate aminotransferase family protein [bacterium]|nr:alanine--glyoxylate aminotransferase family protein [bacterium]